MVKQQTFDIPGEETERAGYNQAQRITETLAMLRNTYVGCMMDEDLSGSLRVARRVLDIISAKLKPDEIIETNKRIVIIKKYIPRAQETFISEGYKYYKDYVMRDRVEIAIEKLWRRIEKLQDDHGYGMLAEEEYGL